MRAKALRPLKGVYGKVLRGRPFSAPPKVIEDLVERGLAVTGEKAKDAPSGEGAAESAPKKQSKKKKK